MTRRRESCRVIHWRVALFLFFSSCQNFLLLGYAHKLPDCVAFSGGPFVYSKFINVFPPSNNLVNPSVEQRNNICDIWSSDKKRMQNVLTSSSANNVFHRRKNSFNIYVSPASSSPRHSSFVLKMNANSNNIDNPSTAAPALSSSSSSSFFSSSPSSSLKSNTSSSSRCDWTGRFCWNCHTTVEEEMQTLLQKIQSRDPSQNEFIQAFKEVLYSLEPLFLKNQKYLVILETIAEPERVVTFRVPWLDDAGRQHVNRGFRVQYSSALGPYKGGLRFHPSVSLSIMKFLGFEQIFKNSLTGLPLGGGKGGADFDPKKKSDAEILRFCQSFMTSLSRHIGHNEDIPAGDIGVGTREIGYLYGQQKRMTSQFEGCLTGKNAKWGGSKLRTEATGYGVVYFAHEVATHRKDSLEGKRCVISGSGNVAQHCAEKLIDMGAKVLTFSDSGGFIHEPQGFDKEKLSLLQFIKNEKKGRVADYVKEAGSGTYYENDRPWNIRCDIAFPCATQNEINIQDAQKLIKNGCKMIVEGANMPTTIDAIETFRKNDVIFCPAKAANAGGVAVSGLEMSQNSMRLYWDESEVDEKLKGIMKNIFYSCNSFAEKFERPNDLLVGANIAGFLKVADSLVEQGCV